MGRRNGKSGGANAGPGMEDERDRQQRLTEMADGTGKKRKEGEERLYKNLGGRMDVLWA